MKPVFFCLHLFLTTFAWSHPGVGIVKDSKGNIYYTDLKQVWKISKDGSRKIVVPGVHTHELHMDAEDQLHGEHLWYNGEDLDTWGSYAWRLKPNGKLDTVVGIHEGFLEHYSFNRDKNGNQYWVERGPVSRIMKKTTGGDSAVLAEGSFKDIRWIHVSPDGRVYFIDLLDLYFINTNGHLTLLVKDLAKKPGPLSMHSEKHSIFGLWTDQDQNLYAAVYSSKTVKKIDPEGKVSDLLYTSPAWSPTGGLFDEEGNLWLMEYNLANEVRVRKVTKLELQKKPSSFRNAINRSLQPASLVLVSLLTLGFIGTRLLKRRN
jgi:hypothetical protein